MLFRNFLLTVCLYASFTSYSQADYAVLSNDAVLEQQFLSSLQSRYEKDLGGLTGKNKKYLAEIYKERLQYIKEYQEAKAVLTHKETHEYLQRLANAILSRNSFLTRNEPLRIYFLRSHWANAASMGEGTIFFNTGLFHRLENEAQAAFVLAHELAHYYLDHSNHNINHYVETIYSDAFQKELKSLSKTEYNRNSQLEKMALTLSFKNRRHSRENEQAADSLAIVLMKNTGFDLYEAVNCLAILDQSDKEKYQSALQLDQVFHFEAFPFKKKWLQSNSLAFAVSSDEEKKNKALADSLKTHPDCATRIERVKAIIQGSAPGKKYLVDEKKFNELVAGFDYEILEHLFNSRKLSRCLYLALQLHQAKPQPYTAALVGKCLNGLYAAQKNHELGRVADLPNPEFDEDYNQLLRLIQNVRLSELAALSYHFLEQQSGSAIQSEEFLAALITSKELFGKPEEKQQWVNYYQKNFSKRKYNFN